VREVNERYLQHPATGSFAADTEGEITQWDTFTARRSGGNTRTGSRNEVAAPQRRRPRAVVVRRIGAGTKGTQGRFGTTPGSLVATSAGFPVRSTASVPPYAALTPRAPLAHRR
jgi:hypothetical protein